MTYFGEKVIGNFRPTKPQRIRDRLAKPAKKRAARPGNSEEHLAAIRKLPCCVTLRTPAGDPHHLKYGTGERGAGMKSSDRWTVPLCRAAHDDLERVGARNEPRWFKDHGIEDPLELADRLWKASPNIEAMTKIVLEHRGLQRLPRR